MNEIFEISEDGKTLIECLDKDIKEVIIPNGITKIGHRAFEDCTTLQSIDIPNSVTEIRKLAFWSCSSLQNINVAENNKQYASVDGILFNKDLTAIIKFPIGKDLKVYEIPNSVTTIGEEAFSRCSALQSIDIPNSVTTIEDRAFECCSALQSINVSENNQYFTSINGIIFNKSLTTIIKFPQGHKLKGYITPNSVTKIGDSAFQGCSSLQHINIPNSVTKIARGAFYGCI